MRCIRIFFGLLLFMCIIQPVMGYSTAAEIDMNGRIGGTTETEETSASSSISDISADDGRRAKAQEDTVLLRRYPFTGEKVSSFFLFGCLLISGAAIVLHLRKDQQKA